MGASSDVIFSPVGIFAVTLTVMYPSSIVDCCKRSFIIMCQTRFSVLASGGTTTAITFVTSADPADCGTSICIMVAPSLAVITDGVTNSGGIVVVVVGAGTVVVVTGTGCGIVVVDVAGTVVVVVSGIVVVVVDGAAFGGCGTVVVVVVSGIVVVVSGAIVVVVVVVVVVVAGTAGVPLTALDTAGLPTPLLVTRMTTE